MNRRIKRFLAALLAAVMMVTMMPTVSLAASSSYNYNETVGSAGEYYIYYPDAANPTQGYLFAGGQKNTISGSSMSFTNLGMSAGKDLVIYTDRDNRILDRVEFDTDLALDTASYKTPAGNTITQWIVGGAKTSTLTATSGGNISVAVADYQTYPVSITAGEHVTITGISPERTEYEAGETITVTAKADEGYDVDPTTTSFTVAAGTNNFTVTATAKTVNVIDASGATTAVTYGGTFTAPAAPTTVPTGKTFVGWLGSNGKLYAAGESYTVDFTTDLTLTALYDDNTAYYFVKYYNVDGSLFNIDAVDKAQANAYNVSTTFPTGAKNEWYDSDSDTANVVTGTQNITGNTAYYSKAAAAKTYTITITEGTSSATTNVTIGQKFTLTAPTTTPADAAFVGWIGNDNKVYRAGENTYSYDGDLVLTALYDNNTNYYFVKYYDAKQKGSLVRIDAVAKADANAYDVSNEYPAHMENHWYNKADDKEVKGTIALTGNLELYALMKQYVVTTSAANGTITVDPNINKVRAGEKVTVTATPDTDYELSALYYVADGSVKTELVPDTNGKAQFIMPTEDVEIVAEFTRKAGTTAYAVTWKAVDEDGTEVTTGTSDITPNGTAKGGEIVTLTYNAPEGYSVKSVEAIGDSGKSYKVTTNGNQYSITMPEEAVQFVINLKAATYTVYFRADGKLVDKVTVKHNGTVTAPAIPDKEGYDADEWVNALNDAKYDAAAKVTADTTYNATYTAKDVTVSYEPAGVATAETKKYGETFTAPTATGVVYWKSSDGRIMEPGKDYKVTENITLTAVQQKANQIVVTYKDMDGKIVDYLVVDENTDFQTKDYTLAGYTNLRWTWKDGTTTKFVDVNDTLTGGLSADTTLTLTGTAATFNITKNNVTGDDNADYGDVVNVEVNKTAKQEFVGISVVGASGKAYSVNTITVGDSYSFVMPAEDVIVTAVLKDIPDDAFAVKFMADGKLVDVQSVTDGKFAAAPADNPTKTGYTFKYWSLNGADAVDVAATAITKDTTFYAVFEVNKAKLTFDPNGGSSVASIDTTYGATATLPTAPTKADSTFVGWQDTATGLVYSENAQYSVTGDASFKAVWAAEDQYVVTFKDTTGALHGYYIVNKGATVTAPAAPTAPTGKTFVEWKSGTTVLQPGETSPAITDKTEFTAQYDDVDYTLTVDGTDANVTEGKYNYGDVISFKPDATSNHAAVKAVYISYNGVTQQLFSADGTYTFTMPAYHTTVHVVREDVMWNIRFLVDGAQYQTASVKDGDQIPAPTAPTKTGYTFKGWSENGTDVITLPTASKNAEYTAVFEANKYDITVNKGTVDNANVAYGGKFELTAPTGAEAKDFLGWSGSDGNYYVAGQTYTFKGTENLKLTAVYSSNTEYYVVRYLYEDGSVYSFQLVDKKGTTDIKLPTYPSVEGYTATGWKTGTTTYVEGDTYPVTANTDFTLAASVQSYTIKVNDGTVTVGTNTGTTQTVAYGGTFQLTAPTAPAGKAFLGWTGTDGNFYAADTTYTFKGTEDLTLTAVYDNDTKYQLAKFYAADGTLANVRLVDSETTTITVPGTADDEWTYTNQTGGTVTVKGGDTVTVSEIKTNSDNEFVFNAVAKQYKAYWKSVDENGVEITDAGATGTNPAPSVDEGKEATISYTGLNTDKYTLKSYYAVGEKTGRHYGVVAIGNDEYVLKSMPNENVTFYFVLAAKQYSVTFKSADGKQLQTGSYKIGEEVTVPRDTAIAEAKPGYKFTGWKSNVTGIPSILESVTKYNLTDAQNVVYTATYDAIDYAVTTLADAHSTITVTDPNPPGTVTAGQDITFKVDANDGYTVSGVTVKETASGKLIPLAYDGTSYQFTMPAASVTIYATSVVNKYTVTFVDDDNTLLGTVAVDHDAVVDDANAPHPTKAGFSFDKWVVLPDGTQQFRIGTDSVKSNLTVKATYVGHNHTVVKGNADNLKTLNAWETTPSYSAAVNSADLLNASTSTTLNTQTGKLVYFEAQPETGYTIKNIYVTAADGSQISVDVQRYSYDAATDHYIMYFTMPDYDMQINVETEAQQFMVSVESNNVKGGTHKINGYSTDNRKITVGDTVTIPVTANEGYVIEKIETSYVNDKGATVTTLGDIAYNGTTASVGDTLNAASAELSFTMVPYPVEVKITYKTLTYNVDVEESNSQTYKPTIKAGGKTEDAESLDDDFTVKGKVYLVDEHGDEIATQKRPVNSVSIDVPGNARYEANSTVNFKVKTYTGYELDKLYATYDNGTKTAVITPLDKNDTYHLTMPTGDVTITATFKEVKNDVIKDASDEEHGKVVVSEIARNTTNTKESNDKRTSVQYKDDVKVTVTPDAGYYVTKIAYTLKDGSVVDFHYQGSTEKPEYTSDKAASSNYPNANLQDDTAHDITFTMPATDVELTVEYAPINYVVSKDYNADEVATFDIENETDSSASLSQANVGDKMFITTEPKHGYDIQDVYITDVNGNTVGIHSESTKDENGGTYSFTMPSEDVTVHVVTVKHAFTVTYRDSAGDVTSEDVKFDETTTKADQLPKNAPDGYHFIGWSSDDVKDNSKHPSRDNDDFVIVKDTIIEAQYAKDETDVVFAASTNGQVEYNTKDGYAAFTEDTKVFGDTIQFTAVPDSGYVVDTITVSTKNSEGEDYNVKFTDTVKGLNHECEFTIPATYKENLDDVNSEDINVTVTFKKAEYLLTDKSAEHHGDVSVNGAVTTQTQFAYDYLDNVNITVTPEAGWYVKSITATGTASGSTFKETATGTKPAVDGVGTALTLTFDMPHEDVDFEVVYEKIDYSIKHVATPTEGGTVTTTPADTAVLDEAVQVHVKPNTGYQLKNLTVTYDNGKKSCKLTQDKTNENEYTFTMPAAGVTVTAEFETVTYNVTAELIGDGKFTINGDYTYATTSRYLDTVTVDVMPDAGWKVKSVVVNNGAVAVTDEGNNKYTFEMPYNDVHVVITLEKIDYTIKTVATPNEGGTVTTTPANNAQVDDVVQVHVAPAEGYQLKKLTVTYANGKKSRQLTQVGSNEYTFTMPADDVTVTAEFETVSYYVTASINGNGKFTLNEDYTYMTTSRYLDTVTVNVMPDSGWRVQSVVANDGTVAVTDEGNGKYTFTMPHKNVNVVITLEKIPYTVDSFAVNYYEDGHGKVTADKTTANVGDKINITADPDEGYHVKDIKVVDKSGNSVPVSIVSEDKDYTKVYSFTMPAEAVDVTVSFSVNASSYYTDVRSDKWYNDAVEFVTDRGYFKGVSADKFGPMINMSRGMFVTVLGRIDADINGLDVSGYDIAKTSFTDVGASQYYAKYIAWAAENGIVTGRTAQTFDPDGNVSREEMAAIMYRYCDYLGIDMSLQNQDFMNRYTDANDIHNYAKTAVSWAVGTGLIQGVSSTSISPRTFATRAQVAQVIKNLSDKVLFNQG